MLNVIGLVNFVAVWRLACVVGAFAGGSIFAPAAAQVPPFTQVNWGIVASQPVTITEAQGRLVMGKLYSFGGYDTANGKWTPVKRSYAYDPLADRWTRLADLPHTPRGSTYGGVTHAGIASDGRDLYLAGGYVSNAAGTSQQFGTRQVWKYVVASDTYVAMPNLPTEMAAAQLEYLNGRLHLLGGTNPTRTLNLGVHYVLDLANMAAGWVASTAMPNPRHHLGSAAFGGKLYVFGGQHNHDANSVPQKDVYCFDPATAQWSRLADLPVPPGASGRSHLSSAVVVHGQDIIVSGGDSRHNVSTAMVSAYTPATNTWRHLTPLPAPRFSGVAAIFGDSLYYSGGNNTATTYKGLMGIHTLAFAPAALVVNTTASSLPQTVQSRLTATAGAPAVSLSVSPLSPWLTLPTAALGDLAMVVDPSGLPPGSYSATVSAGSQGYTGASLTVSLNVGADSLGEAVRINAGGEAFVATDGRRFERDMYYGGNNRVRVIASGEILNTLDDPLYRSTRSAAGFNYRIPISNGNMTVTLHFAETWFGAPGGAVGGSGKRLFHVDVEGVRRLTNHDIYAKAGGAMRASQESFEVSVIDGLLAIDFLLGAADQPNVAAIEVVMRSKALSVP